MSDWVSQILLAATTILTVLCVFCEVHALYKEEVFITEAVYAL